MIIARLEKRTGIDPRDSWWLLLENGAGHEVFHLAEAIDSQAIVQRAITAQAKKFVIDLASLISFDS